MFDRCFAPPSESPALVPQGPEMSRGVARLLKGGQKKNKVTATVAEEDVFVVRSPGGGSPGEAGEGGGGGGGGGSYQHVDAGSVSLKPGKKGASSRGNKSSGFQMHVPGKGAARKVASAFKRKIRGRSSKGIASEPGDGGDDLLVVADDDGASWLEDSDDDGEHLSTTEEVEASPEVGPTPNSVRSRSPAHTEEEAGHDSSEFELVETSSVQQAGSEDGCSGDGGCRGGSSPKERVEDASSLEVGETPTAAPAAAAQSSSRTAPSSSSASTLPAPQVPTVVAEGGAAKSKGDNSRPRPQVYGGASGGGSSGRGGGSTREQQLLPWDAKRFKNVKPLHCSSIWDIPTSRDPNPEPRPVPPPRTTDSLLLLHLPQRPRQSGGRPSNGAAEVAALELGVKAGASREGDAGLRQASLHTSLGWLAQRGPKQLSPLLQNRRIMILVLGFIFILSATIWRVIK